MTDKDEIIKLAEEYLRQNSLVDLTGLIQENCPPTHTHSAFVRDIAYKMRATGQFEITEKEVAGRFYAYRIPRKNWRDRNPLMNDFRVAVISAILSLTVGWVLLNIEESDKDKKYKSDLLTLKDVVDNLEKRIRQIEDR